MSISVMSFNVRYDNPDEAPEDKWDVRKPVCAEIIAKYKPALVGMQEPHKHQVEQLSELLPQYGWFGTGRYVSVFGINETHNELNPVFYDKEVLTLDTSGTWWYSDTPSVPQSKWDCSAFPRIATWGRFTVTATGQRICFINTHFDHESEEARTRAAEFLIAKIPEVSLGLPVVVVGDLNAGHGSPAVDKLSAALSECSSQCCEAVLPGMLGKCATFVGFDKSIDSQIDFIFASNGLKPAGYGTIPDECPNGRCCSDHRPILATLEFGPDCANAPEPARGEEGAAGGGGGGDAAAELAAKAADKVASKLSGFFGKFK